MNLSGLDFEGNFAAAGWSNAAAAICLQAGVKFSRIERADSSDHVVFLIDDRFVLKIFRPSRACFERETKALEFSRGRLLFATPEIVGSGRFEDWDWLIMTQVPGRAMTRAEFLGLPAETQLRLVRHLADGLRQIHAVGPEPFADDWATFVANRSSSFIERQIGHGVDPKIIDALPAFIEKHLPRVPLGPTVFLHGDVHFGNLRFESADGEERISGLFDFADSRRGFHEYDLLAVGVLMIQGERELQREFFGAYGYAESDLTEEMRGRMMMLTMLYETSDLRRYATRLSPAAVDLGLDELTRAIWSFV